MIHRIVSQYNVNYPRALTYMLQATEYNIKDYLAWYHRVSDFGRVEQRKELVPTKKSTVVMLLIAGFQILYMLGALGLIAFSRPFGVLWAMLIMFFGPIVTGYAVILPLWLGQTFIQKPMEKKAMARTKERLVSHKALKIGIAGSFGKTSMREILKTILQEGKRVAAPSENFNTPLGISKFVEGLSGDEEVLIFELGEYYPGDVRLLCDMVQPDMGVITGVNEAHLDRFGTIERSVATIFELADFLGNKRTYVNGENQLARSAARPGHIVYTRSGTAEVHVDAATTSLAGTDFRIGQTPMHTQLLGLHQVGPLAAAVDMALHLGLTMEQIQRGIAKTVPYDHRMEQITDSAGVTLLDDSYNGNPDGVAAVIEFLGSIEGRRRFYMTPGLVEMGSRTAEVHRIIGKQITQAGIEHVILIKNSVTSYIQEGLEAAGYRGQIHWFSDALLALGSLPHITVKGDIVLLQNDWPDQYA